MSIDPKRIFLVDGVGALITATTLVAILGQFESTFGMPQRAIYFLAAIAVSFAIYSLACYFKLPSNWPPFLRTIAIANLSYCILTLVLISVFRNEITTLGIAYFAAEIIVVSTLAIYELITAHRRVDR